MHARVTRDHIMTTSFTNALTPISIESGTAEILIDPLPFDSPSWGNAWDGNRAGEDSTHGDAR